MKDKGRGSLKEVRHLASQHFAKLRAFTLTTRKVVAHSNFMGEEGVMAAAESEVPAEEHF